MMKTPIFYSETHVNFKRNTWSQTVLLCNKTKPRRTKLKNNLLYAFCAAALLSACQSVPAPDVSTRHVIPAQFAAAPDNPSATNLARWWQQFHDPALNVLVQRALASAPDLAIANARLAQAKATAQLAGADLGLLIGSGGGIGIGGGKTTNPLPQLLPKGDKINEGGGGAQGIVGASWALDFFGKKQSDADAAYYAFLGEKERLHGAQILLLATLGQYYIEARAAEANALILKKQLHNIAELRRYAKARFEAGQATQYNLSELDSKAAGLKAKGATLEAERANAVANIAALIGAIPQGFHLERDGGKIFQQLPAPPSGQYPSELITRRPDIRGRKAAVMARAAQKASAQADFYPRFTLNFGLASGVLNLGGDLAQQLGASGGLIGASVQLPIFTNGRLQANLDKADATLTEALSEYDKTLLTSLAETDNSYRLASALRQQERDLASAEKTTRAQSVQAQKLFEFGRETFDQVIKTRLEVDDYEEKRLQNQRGQALNLLRLYAALGGGWSEKGEVNFVPVGRVKDGSQHIDKATKK